MFGHFGGQFQLVVEKMMVLERPIKQFTFGCFWLMGSEFRSWNAIIFACYCKTTLQQIKVLLFSKNINSLLFDVFW